MSWWDKCARLRRSTTTRAPITARLRDESGIALILAIGVMMVLIIVVASVIGFTSAGTRNANRSQRRARRHTRSPKRASTTRIAVLNAQYALPGPYADGVDFFTPPVAGRADPATVLALPLASRTTTYDVGTVTWKGTYCFATGSAEELAAGCDQLLDWGIWRIEAVATVRNPTGPGAAPVRRRIKAAVQAILPPSTPPSDGLWNWIFSGKPPTPRLASRRPDRPLRHHRGEQRQDQLAVLRRRKPLS